MKAEHGGLHTLKVCSDMDFPDVVHATGAEKCLESIPSRSMHQGIRWSTRGSRGLLATCRQNVLSTSLTIIVPWEPQRAVVYTLKFRDCLQS